MNFKTRCLNGELSSFHSTSIQYDIKILVKPVICLTLIWLSFFVAACKNESIPTSVQTRTLTSKSVVFFPQQAPVTNGQRRVVLTASLTGKLVTVNDCLRIISKHGKTSYLVIWPPDVLLRDRNDLAEIRSLSGQVLVQVGQEIRLGGGELAASESRWVSTLLRQGQKLPESCPGPYWLVGFEISPA